MTALPAFLADPAVSRLLAALPDARVVGGAVRDWLAGRPVADIDLATPHPPDAVAAILSRAGIRTIPTGLEHGTLTAVIDGRGFEITTLRRDVSTDGRRAVVAFTSDWREDAARRDFTFNAMSLAPDGGLFDYFHGQDDLRAGIVRFIGDAAARVAEDYLRILRFFRFFARFGMGAPDPDAVIAIRSGLAGLATLSVERVWNELSGILTVPDPRRALQLMSDLGVLAAIVPEATDIMRLSRLIGAGAPIDPVLRLAALLTGDAAALGVRLKLSVAAREHLIALAQPSALRPEDDDAALRRALTETEVTVLEGRTWLAGGDAPPWAALRARLRATPRPVFPLEGRHVLDMGIPPGPRVGMLLRAVRAWWLDRGCTDAVGACLDELRRQSGSAPLAQMP